MAGVSTKTVSRVVNNQGEVSQDTRQRVEAAVRTLGYQPNALARSLARRRTHTLAVVAWGLEYFGPSRTVIGSEQQCYEMGYSLLLQLLARPDETRVSVPLNALIARRVDGIVWAVPEIGENRAWIGHEQVGLLPPIVFLSSAARGDLSVVAVDNRLGGAYATQHLIDQGRRRIGIITGPLAWWEARERHAGWEESLQRAGREASASLVAEGDWSAESGERGMRTLMARRPDVDAVFACNDPMALGCLRVAQEAGRRVPQDLAVVGFDNTPDSAYFQPPLTSVFQPLVEVGRNAVLVLHALIEAQQRGEDHTEEVAMLLKPELVIRESSHSNVQPSLPSNSTEPSQGA